MRCSFFFVVILVNWCLLLASYTEGTRSQEYDEEEKAKEIVADILEDNIRRSNEHRNYKDVHDFNEKYSDDAENDDDDGEEFDEMDDVDLDPRVRNDPHPWWSRSSPTRNSATYSSSNHHQSTTTTNSARPKEATWRWRRVYAHAQKLYHKVRPYVPHIMTGAKAMAALGGKKRELFERQQRRRKEDYVGEKMNREMKNIM